MFLLADLIGTERALWKEEEEMRTPPPVLGLDRWPEEATVAVTRLIGNGRKGWHPVLEILTLTRD